MCKARKETTRNEVNMSKFPSFKFKLAYGEKELREDQEKGILEAIEHYQEEYKAPASISDIQFLLTIPHGSPLDKQIDKSLERAPQEIIKQNLSSLIKQGKIEKTEYGGYVEA